MGEDSRPKTLVRSVLVNTAWGFAGRVLGGVFALITVALMSRALGPQGYGAYATLLAFLYLFQAVADGGFYNVLVRDIARPQKKPENVVATAFTLRLITLGVSLSAGFAAMFFIPQYSSLTAAAPFAVIAYAALSLSQLLMAIFQKHLAVSYAAFAEMGARLLQLAVVAALFVIHTSSLVPFVAALAAAGTLQFLLSFLFARRYVAVRLTRNVMRLRRYFFEALPVALSLVFTLIYFKIDTVLLSLLKSPEEVGIYNISYKLLEQLIFFPAMFMGVVTPILSEAFATNKDRFAKIFRLVNSAITIAALPVLIGGWFLAEPIVTILGGEAFLPAAAPLRVLLFATVFIFFGNALGNTVIVAGRQKAAVPIYALAMVINVGGNLLFIPQFSFMAAAWTTVIAELVVDAGLVWLLVRSGIAFTVPRIFRVLLAAGIMGLPLLFFGEQTLAALGVFGVIPFLIICPLLYGGALIVLRAVNKDELRQLFVQRPAPDNTTA